MSEQYEIKGYLNHGGFGITYLAKDSLSRDVVVKECFPSSMCQRDNLNVRPRSRAHMDDLQSVIRLFTKEAQALSKVEHPNIVRVHQVFQENETAYMVLDFVDGSDLLTHIEKPADRLKPETIKSALKKMLDAIGFVHDAGVLHRDISPDNIILTKSLEPMLIDFGAARQKASKATQALSALRVVKDGYSPQEFYLAGSVQAPASDLYSLAATFYHLITGEIPPDSQMRLTAHVTDDGDPYVPLSQKTDAFDESFCAAIDKAMAILPRDRMQTAAEWIKMMDEKPKPVVRKMSAKIPSRRLSRKVQMPVAPVKPKKKPSKAKGSIAAFALSLVAAGILVGGTVFAPTDEPAAVLAADQGSAPQITAPQTVAEPAQVATTTSTTTPAPQQSAPTETAFLATDTSAPAVAVQTAPLSILPTNWADGNVTLAWAADLPFVLNGDATLASTDEFQMPITIGSRLTSVNGQDVADVEAINAAITNAVNGSDGTSVQLALGWSDPETTNTITSQLSVGIIYRTQFSSGVRFATRKAADAWVTKVTQTPQTQDYPLKLGDQVVALIPENARIDAATSLAEVVDQAWSQGRTELKFAVRRDDTLWTANIDLIEEAG